MRGSTTAPSNHTFGTAFDINHQQNGLGVTPPAAGKPGSVRLLVPFFEKHGFFWGGNYKHRADGMHFEIATLKPDVSPAPSAVEVFVNGTQRVVPALFISNKTFVGVKALLQQVGGSIVKVDDKPFSVTVNVKGANHVLTGRNIDGAGYVAFGDINALLGLPFKFDNAAKRLDITKQ